jgi:hypothetical protein
VCWPSLHLELSTRAAYRCCIDKHYLLFFGAMAMQDVLPSHVQAWVTTAIAHGLSPRSVVKYHVLLHGIFKQAVRDRIILHNPTLDTRLAGAYILALSNEYRLLNHILLSRSD